jgi:hypothetical protein
MMGDSPIVAWYPSVTADDLSRVMLEDDPRMLCTRGMESVIGAGGGSIVYKFSDTLALKDRCCKRETDFMTLAGDLSMPLVSIFGKVERDTWYQRGVVMELGTPLEVENIHKKDRPSVAFQMLDLVNGLRRRKIVHGDIKPANMVWDKNRRIRLIDFGSARMADGSDLDEPETFPATREYLAPNRSPEYRPPTLIDDAYALAVSIWAVFAGESPDIGLFNQNGGPMPDLSKITDPGILDLVLDLLEDGGFDLNSAMPPLRHNHSCFGASSISTHPASEPDEDDGRASSISSKSSYPQQVIPYLEDDISGGNDGTPFINNAKRAQNVIPYRENDIDRDEDGMYFINDPNCSQHFIPYHENNIEREEDGVPLINNPNGSQHVMQYHQDNFDLEEDGVPLINNPDGFQHAMQYHQDSFDREEDGVYLFNNPNDSQDVISYHRNDIDEDEDVAPFINIDNPSYSQRVISYHENDNDNDGDIDEDEVGAPLINNPSCSQDVIPDLENDIDVDEDGAPFISNHNDSQHVISYHKSDMDEDEDVTPFVNIINLSCSQQVISYHENSIHGDEDGTLPIRPISNPNCSQHVKPNLEDNTDEEEDGTLFINNPNSSQGVRPCRERGIKGGEEGVSSISKSSCSQGVTPYLEKSINRVKEGVTSINRPSFSQHVTSHLKKGTSRGKRRAMSISSESSGYEGGEGAPSISSMSSDDGNEVEAPPDNGKSVGPQQVTLDLTKGASGEARTESPSILTSQPSEEPQGCDEIQQHEEETEGEIDYPEFRHLRVLNTASFLQRRLLGEGAMMAAESYAGGYLRSNSTTARAVRTLRHSWSGSTGHSGGSSSWNITSFRARTRSRHRPTVRPGPAKTPVLQEVCRAMKKPASPARAQFFMAGMELDGQRPRSPVLITPKTPPERQQHENVVSRPETNARRQPTQSLAAESSSKPCLKGLEDTHHEDIQRSIGAQGALKSKSPGHFHKLRVLANRTVGNIIHWHHSQDCSGVPERPNGPKILKPRV